VEQIEIRLHPFGLSLQVQALPFSVAAGASARVTCELRLHQALPPGTQVLYLATRGEAVRPAWTKLAIAGRLQGQLTLAGSLPGTPELPPADLTLTLQHAGDTALRETLTWTLEPPDLFSLGAAPVATGELPPGQARQWPLTLTCRHLPKSGLTPWVTVQVSGAALAPLRLTVAPRYPLPRLSAEVPLKDLPDLLISHPAYAIGTGRVPLALVRLARCGEALALVAEVRDSATELGGLIWDGSCVEVFGAMPDQRRLGAVFGNLKIGQVLLQPSIAIQEARAWRQVGEDAVADPGIQLDTWEKRTGYTLLTLIPLDRLQVSPEAEGFLLEIAITIRDPTGQCRRAKLGGSSTPFNDSACFLHFHS
jgi:hypothetical protein